MTRTKLPTYDSETLEVKGLKFHARPNTSDVKAIHEVVVRKAYGRHGFTPGEGERWLDLGANVGAFSVWAASQHPSIEVLAVEPDPVMCQMITDNAKLNRVSRQITVCQAAAVAEEDGPEFVTLHCNVARGNTWRNSIMRHWRGEEDIQVQSIYIGELIEDDRWIKMDIEGAEMPILEELIVNNMLDGTPGIVFEWSFDVDPKIDRLQDVLEGLDDIYSTVITPGRDKLPASGDWPASWFPPCKMVWASS